MLPWRALNTSVFRQVEWTASRGRAHANRALVDLVLTKDLKVVPLLVVPDLVEAWQGADQGHGGSARLVEAMVEAMEVGSILGEPDLVEAGQDKAMEVELVLTEAMEVRSVTEEPDLFEAAGRTRPQRSSSCGSMPWRSGPS